MLVLLLTSESLSDHSPCSCWATEKSLYLAVAVRSQNVIKTALRIPIIQTHLWGLSLQAALSLSRKLLWDMDVAMVLSLNHPAGHEHSQPRKELAGSSSAGFRGAGPRGRFHEGLVPGHYKHLGEKCGGNTKCRWLKGDQAVTITSSP